MISFQTTSVQHLSFRTSHSARLTDLWLQGCTILCKVASKVANHYNKDMGKIEECGRWLHGYLRSGPQPAKGVLAAAAQEGYGSRTLNTAKARIGVTSFRKAGTFYWQNTTGVLIDQGKKPDVLVAALLELTAAIREATTRGIQGEKPEAAAPAPFFEEEKAPFDLWSDMDYDTSTYEELIARVLELQNELAWKEKEHGKKMWVHGQGLQTVSHARDMKALKEEIARANEFAEAKFTKGTT
jgi:hypothetical protein